VKLGIRNRTAYRFDQPVFLEPHVIRLRPRIDAALWPLALTLDVDPRPAGRAEYLDLEGNVVTQVWFDGMTDHFTIESRSTVETLVTDPFRYLLDDPDRALPRPYPAELENRLSAYRRASDSSTRAVQELALATAEAVGRRPDTFVTTLTTRLHREFEVETREEGPPNRPEATLAQRRGACRDIAVVFIACCRAMGLAARFASGYVYIDGSGERALHAWAEVYLSGGGWRGYDPTLGLVVADRHVVVAAAAEPADAAPLSGSFRGSATSILETEVEVTAAP